MSALALSLGLPEIVILGVIFLGLLGMVAGVVFILVNRGKTGRNE